MKKIFDVNVRMTDSGKMVVLVRYIDNNEIKTTVEPFSEELLIKYKKKYIKEKIKEKKLLEKIKEETDNEKIEINTKFFVKLALLGGTVAISLAGIATAAYMCMQSLSNTFINLNDLESPIILDEEIDYSIDMHK